MISDIKYSPCGNLLAISSLDGFLDIYDCSSFIKQFSIKSQGNFIIHFDWSTDSKYISTNSDSGHLMYHNLEKGSKITNSDVLKTLNWSTNTRVYSWEAQSIWNANDNNTIPKSIDLYRKEIKGDNIMSVGYSDGSSKLFK